MKERGMYSPLMQVYLAYLVSKGVRTWYEESPLKGKVDRVVTLNEGDFRRIYPQMAEQIVSP